MAIGAGTVVFVTYHAITKPGRRNNGPPYSHAQFPGGSCRWEKNDKALFADARGVSALGRFGKSYPGHSQYVGSSCNLCDSSPMAALDGTCQLWSAAMTAFLYLRSYSAMFDVLVRPTISIFQGL